MAVVSIKAQEVREADARANFAVDPRTNPLGMVAQHEGEDGSAMFDVIPVNGETWLVLSAGLTLPVSGRAGAVVCDIIRVDDGVGHIAPAGVVSAWNGGTLDLAIEANQFTPTIAPSGTSVPASDIEAFGADGSQGGFGLLVQLLSADGDILSDNRVEITTLTLASHIMRLDAAFTLGGGGAISPSAGQIVTLAPLGNTYFAEIAGGTISVHQDDYIHIADSDPATPYIDTNVPAYRWGV